MKRTIGFAIPILFLCVLFFVSCDALFENNLFAGLTHQKLTADSIHEQTPSELEDTLSSEVYMDQIINDPELLNATLDMLAGYYTSNPESAEGQTAAILAANIIIQTNPTAAQFSAAAVGAIQSIMDLANSETEPTADDVLGIINSILPADILQAFNAGSPTPPQSFIDIVNTYSSLYPIYTALNNGLNGSYAADVDAGEAVDIAVNAVFTGVISLIDPLGGQDVASALWSAMLDPEHASSYLNEPDFESVFGETTGSLANILTVTSSYFEN